MTHRVPMKDCMELMHKMARVTRARHGVPYGEIESPYMEQDYNIKFVYDNKWLLNPNGNRCNQPGSYVEFASESQYTMFVLKYQ